MRGFPLLGAAFTPLRNVPTDEVRVEEEPIAPPDHAASEKRHFRSVPDKNECTLIMRRPPTLVNEERVLTQNA